MSQIYWFGWLGVGVLASTLAVFALHPTAHGSSDASLLAQRTALGKELFNDPSLSADGTVRCASCHIPEKGYADGRATAVGIFGRVGTRNTPSLLSVEIAKEGAFFWDGRRTVLEQAVLDPITNPVEMGLHDQAQVMQRIGQNSTYRVAFAQAFPKHGDAFTPDDVGVALATYIRSLTPPESAFDRYTRGNRAALNPRAQLGLALFQGKAGCAECHRLEGASPTFTDHAYHRTGVGLDGITANLPVLTKGVITRSLQGGAIGDRVATHEDEAQLGRFNVTLEPADIGLFHTPSLRSVSRTAPYMHDGSVPTLEDAIDREVYYRSLQAGRPLNLSVEERLDLAEFLRSL
ncbi:cytochrome c peroxidase [Burkholderia pseudomallei]|uniref:cytochrome-c peroxidase n=1 Tax=Burkholderia pseudomallei TaxID=28450 RepID=UPI000F0646F5|nr:cytochrome c peroxidase [Burkholderia pseudomallei]CAJ9345952.1 cytochrome c family protein [Burkholderia pseudomallei]VBN64151.1 cytochrome c peroxidase [Burkholderia pseudomallei]